MPRSSNTRKTQPATTRDKARPPAIRGEKRVKETNATVPVAPARRKPGTHAGPTDPAAIDRRRQFSGTDEPADPKRGKTSQRRGGGNAGRGAVGLPGRV
jgi:hypothetical protein